MPKVVSRSTVSASTDTPATKSSEKALKVFYCMCGEFILVIDKNLSNLPRRQTDGATIVRCQDAHSAKACIFKLNATNSGPVLVEREGGHERQYRFHCPRCNLLVGYQPTPHPAKSGPFLYILHGALSTIQGQVPADAFDGENEVGESGMAP